MPLWDAAESPPQAGASVGGTALRLLGGPGKLPAAWHFRNHLLGRPRARQEPGSAQSSPTEAEALLLGVSRAPSTDKPYHAT